ncbi:MAG: hypothetical protein QM831_42200 [Kofleriaceae bacterium]
MRALLIVIALCGAARAEQFDEVVANQDGGAWVSSSDHLRHISPSGEITVEPVKLDAIAIGPDDSLWAVSGTRVMHRRSTGWSTSELPAAAPGPVRLAVTATNQVVIARQCPDRNDGHFARRCTEVRVVGQDPIALEGDVEALVADAKGGAWIALVFDVEHGTLPSIRRRAFHHFDGAHWSPAQPLGEDPTSLAPFGDGVIGASGNDLFTLAYDADGNLTKTDRGRTWPGLAIAVTSRATVVTGMTSACGLCQHEHDDCTPSLVTDTHVELVPVPGWWRRAQVSCPARIRVAHAGDHLWLVTPQAIFHRDPFGWHTIEADRARDDLNPLTRQAFSLQGTLGGGNGGFAYGLRPELIFTRDVIHPTWGVGPYLELGKNSDFYAGGGITVVHYWRELAASASLGIAGVDHTGFHPQPVGSLFFGFRAFWDTDLPLDAPIGIRVDFRPATGPVPMTVTASLSFDLPSVALLFGALTRH